MTPCRRTQAGARRRFLQPQGLAGGRDRLSPWRGAGRHFRDRGCRGRDHRPRRRAGLGPWARRQLWRTRADARRPCRDHRPRAAGRPDRGLEAREFRRLLGASLCALLQPRRRSGRAALRRAIRRSARGRPAGGPRARHLRSGSADHRGGADHARGGRLVAGGHRQGRCASGHRHPARHVEQGRGRGAQRRGARPAHDHDER